ncbi:MAG: NfeD family protein [Sedimentisphaerales bacterium]|nr:NfeD family protein [Sedimentisphaerales bacterium]
MKQKALIKYILLQIPELVVLIIALALINRFITIPTWLMITIIVIWIGKDIALFPKVWKSYVSDNPSPMEQLIGMNGIAMDSLNPDGYVKVKGELWKAEIRDLEFPLKEGDEIKVSDVEGMTLIVKRSDNN